jgi:hypothetical protein
VRRSWTVVLSLVSLCACGHSAASFTGDGGAGDAAPHDGGVGDGPAGGDDATTGAPDGGAVEDAGEDAEEAGAVASLCVGVGAACKSTASCLCGVGSGCTFDNVACDAGVCVVVYDVILDAGEACCAACQGTYDSCTGKDCLSQWMTCNDGCEGACPVLCLAAQSPPP